MKISRDAPNDKCENYNEMESSQCEGDDHNDVMLRADDNNDRECNHRFDPFV